MRPPASPEQYIHVVNWDRFQHYKVRGAPWIKSYTALLNDRRYLRLTLRQRGLLHSVHLAYAATGRDLGTSTADLRRVLGEDTVRPRDIERLVDAGFLIISASKVLAQREREIESKEQPAQDPPSRLNNDPPPAAPSVEPKPRERDLVWDFVVVIEGEPLPRYKPARARIVNDLKMLLLRSEIAPAGQDAELHRRHDALAREWGDSKATARALVQHWDRAAKLAAPVNGSEPEVDYPLLPGYAA